jgi:hypothetical protein
MIAYQAAKSRSWVPAPTRNPQLGRPAAIGQDLPRKQKPLDLNSDDVYEFAVIQGVTLAYAATASFLYGKSHPIVDRILLGIGALGFGVSSLASYKMLDQSYSWHPLNGVVGGVMGTMNALIAIGAGVATFKKKLPGSSAEQAVASALPM